MRNLILLLFITPIFLASSCDDEGLQTPSGEIELNFKAFFGDDPLVMYNSTYDYDTDVKVFFEKFQFYLADVVLLGDSNTGEEELVEIDLIDFTGMQDQAAAEAGVTKNFNDIPVGNYTAIRLGIGVPADQNATQGTDYSDSHPLGIDGMYWSGWSSFIFAKIEGKTDSNGDGVHDDANLSYHTGTDEVYQEIVIPIQLMVEENKKSPTIGLDVNIQTLFQHDAGLLDIIENPGVHTDQHLHIAKAIMDMFQDAVSLRQ